MIGVVYESLMILYLGIRKSARLIFYITEAVEYKKKEIILRRNAVVSFEVHISLLTFGNGRVRMNMCKSIRAYSRKLEDAKLGV